MRQSEDDGRAAACCNDLTLSEIVDTSHFCAILSTQLITHITAGASPPRASLCPAIQAILLTSSRTDRTKDLVPWSKLPLMDGEPAVLTCVARSFPLCIRMLCAVDALRRA